MAAAGWRKPAFHRISSSLGGSDDFPDLVDRRAAKWKRTFKENRAPRGGGVRILCVGLVVQLENNLVSVTEGDC